MNFRTLIRRSLRFHWRSHLGVVLGAAIGSAALIGALVVGDSVKGSLREQALQRLGKAEIVMSPQERFFRRDLAADLQAHALAGQFCCGSLTGQVASLLLLPATALVPDGTARANKVNVMEVDPTFGIIAADQRYGLIHTDEVLLNQALADKLNAKPGDSVLLRVRKPSALSAEVAVSTRADAAWALRLRVRDVVLPVTLGNFELSGGSQPPLNAFVALGTIPFRTDGPRMANIILDTAWGSSAPGAGQPSSSAKGANMNLWEVLQLADTDHSIAIRETTACADLKTPRIFLDPPVARAAFLAESNAQPILTYLATLLSAGTNATPYSMLTAAGAPWTPADLRDDEIVVSQWLADDLKVKPGDEIALSYFLPESGAKLEEAKNTFRVHSIAPMEMPWADRTLMPDFPGIEKAESTSEWDAGFPLTYEIRKKDDDYWKQYRGTPKAFITLAAGQKLWGNRFGNLTAIRFPIPASLSATNYQAELEKKILTNLKPEELGLRFEPVREQALKAAAQSQDFGGLFLGFSFFVIIAALLLMMMLFQFGLEQRAPEVGTLLALGFTPVQVRKLLLREGAALAFIGGVVGAVVGIYFAKVMLLGLTTVWRGAVGATALQFHLTGQTLVIGIFASVVVSTLTIWLALRKFVKRSPRELLVGEIQTEESKVSSLKSKVVAIAATVLALGLVGWTLAKSDTAKAGAFFGAGALVLIAGLNFVSAWLAQLGGAPNSNSARSQRTPTQADLEIGAPFTTLALAVRGCARRRNRSLATVAMLASGSFLIVSIGVFRLDANRDATERSSGTGGFALIGETTLPVVQDLNSASGRDFFALSEQDLVGVSFVPFRVRAGDEASCLNLNRAQKPRLLGVKPELLEGRFTIAKGDGWPMLGNRQPAMSESLLTSAATKEVEIAAIGDANSIQWAMGKNVGDTIDYVDERGQPFKVRIVGAVANSILQGQLLIDEAEFVKRFPGESGYRMFLIDAPSNAVSQVSATLSRAMQDVGLELTPTATRLNQFNAVQNTYLGNFQVLGGLGLLLGSVGLGIVVLRNVLERRSELAVLMAVGFRRQQVQRLLLMENGALLLLGLILGLVAAGVAVLPAVLSSAAQLPVWSLAITLGAILLNGFLWTWLATRFAVRGDLLAALRND